MWLLRCAVAFVGARTALSQTAVVHADQAVGTMSPALRSGVGIEDVNHELVGTLYSQLIWGESFEEPQGQDGVSGSAQAETTWTRFPGSDAGCGLEVASGTDAAYTGVQSQMLHATAVNGGCGIMNRGLVGSGLAIDNAASYTGYFFVRVVAIPSKAMSITVSLIDAPSGAVLSSAIVPVPMQAGWLNASFTLPATSGAAGCILNGDSTGCASNAEGMCSVCNGAFVLQLNAPGTLLIDQVFLMNTAQQYAGLQVRPDIVRLLNGEGSESTPGMGVTGMRLGGSAILVDGYRWKDFRGPPSKREPYTGYWYPNSSRGYGFFEFLQLCQTLNTSCVVTMNSAETAQDVQDFVEYLYGPPDSVWGALRVADGQAAPFLPFAIEIGNEQQYDAPDFIQQVVTFATALNTSAAALALPFRLKIIVGALWIPWTPSTAAPMVQALAPLAPYMDIGWDFHVGGDTPSTDPDAAFLFLRAVRDVFNSTGVPVFGAVLEENGGLHDMQRALGHARMANRFRCLADFVQYNTAANGLQFLSANSNSWDQGHVFVVQEADTAYLSPPGMANAISAQTEPAAGGIVVAVEAAGLMQTLLDVVAVRDPGSSQLTVRVVNPVSTPYSLTISLQGCTVTNSTVQVVSLSGNLTDTNTPLSPRNVAPRYSVLSTPTGPSSSFTASISPTSINAFVVQCAVSGPTTRWVPAAADGVLSTCDIASAANGGFSWLNHSWSYLNTVGAWLPPAGGGGGGDGPTVTCNSDNCFDMAIATDVDLPTTGPLTISSSFTFHTPPNPASQVDGGFLARVVYPGTLPGADAFDGYELSLGPGTGGAGYVMLGAHFYGYKQLAQVPLAVPFEAAHTLTATLTPAPDGVSWVAFQLAVNGTTRLTYNDTVYSGAIAGGSVGIRSFYNDMAWHTLSFN